METAIKYKPLLLFIIAACSLLCCGFLFNKQNSLIQLILLLWCTVSGIYIVYRFNDFIDQSKNFKFNVQRYFSSIENLTITLQLLLLAAPISIYYLSSFQILVLSIACATGLIYSINFSHNNKNYRVKNIFLLKNIFIGFSWGALTLIGANNFEIKTIAVLFLFASLQVVIGSIIRDIPDVLKDYEDNVKTLPIVAGIKSTLIILSAFNLALLSILTLETEYIIKEIVLFTIIWRSFLLIMLFKNYESKLWTQTINVSTCLVIFIIALIKCLL